MYDFSFIHSQSGIIIIIVSFKTSFLLGFRSYIVICFNIALSWSPPNCFQFVHILNSSFKILYRATIYLLVPIDLYRHFLNNNGTRCRSKIQTTTEFQGMSVLISQYLTSQTSSPQNSMPPTGSSRFTTSLYIS